MAHGVIDQTQVDVMFFSDPTVQLSNATVLATQN